MTVDGKDTVYVGDLVGGGIQAFTSEGEFLELFARTAGGGVTGLAADSAGNIYAVDKLNDRLTKFDPKGRLELQWGESGSEAGQFSKPWGVAVDPQGNVYVSDTGNSRVQKFDATGIFLTEWGGPGEAQGFFRDIKGIAVNPAGQVLVADTSNNRIQRFTTEGQFIDQWGLGQITHPTGIAVDGLGAVYVTTVASGTEGVWKFSSDGVLVTRWGQGGSGDGQFAAPQGIALDGAGNVYVADTDNARIHKFEGPGRDAFPATATPTAAPTPIPVETPTPSVAPTTTVTSTPAPTSTKLPTPSPAPTPTPSPSPVPTPTSTPTATPTPTPSPTPFPTLVSMVFERTLFPLESEIHVDIESRPGAVVTVRLQGPALRTPEQQLGTIGANGELRLTWRIIPTIMDTYSLSGTVDGVSISQSLVVS